MEGRSQMKFCPKCDADITHTYEAYEPDVGIMSGGWYCEKCEIFVNEADDDGD
jgi:hypothetical protein